MYHFSARVSGREEEDVVVDVRRVSIQSDDSLADAIIEIFLLEKVRSLLLHLCKVGSLLKACFREA